MLLFLFGVGGRIPRKRPVRLSSRPHAHAWTPGRTRRGRPGTARTRAPRRSLGWSVPDLGGDGRALVHLTVAALPDQPGVRVGDEPHHERPLHPGFDEHFGIL